MGVNCERERERESKMIDDKHYKPYNLIILS